MKVMIKVMLVGLLMMSFCATYTMLGLSEAEKDYYRVVMKFPTTFRVPKEAGKEAWIRAHQWILDNSRRPIVEANDYVIQTTIPDYGNQNDDWGYAVYRYDSGDSITFDVRCYSIDMFREPGLRASHILAYYISSGRWDSDVFKK